jgi:hypothetical protein
MLRHDPFSGEIVPPQLVVYVNYRLQNMKGKVVSYFDIDADQRIVLHENEEFLFFLFSSFGVA